MRRASWVVLFVAFATCVACSSSKSPAATPSNTSTGSASGTVVVKTTTSSLGTFLVDSSGRTLYLFVADKGSSSTCYTACATTWPPLLTKGTPAAQGGAVSGELGTTKRTDGSLEVTYAGHPLYYYAADTKPGMTTGQALNQFGALWYVVSPAGNAITKTASSPAATATSSSGY